tara:strand:+ start:51 stop:314 length:264 start_codon:yes stop_codon:yes gene_type:complete
MKISKTQLKQIIKEEISNVLREGDPFVKEMEEAAIDFLQIYADIPNLEISVENDGYQPNLQVSHGGSAKQFADVEAMREYLDSVLGY